MSKEKEEFEQFGKRAALAEKQIKDLAKRVAKLEVSAGVTAEGPSSIAQEGRGAGALEAYQREMLTQLRQLRDVSEEDQRVLQAVVAERDQAVKEKDQLRAENKRLHYRVNILLRSLAEAESKNKQTHS